MHFRKPNLAMVEPEKMDLNNTAKKGHGRSILQELEKSSLPDTIINRAGLIFNQLDNLGVIKKGPRRMAIFFCALQAYHSLKNEFPRRRIDFTIDPGMLCNSLGFPADKAFMRNAVIEYTHATGYRHVICEDTIEDFVQVFFQYAGLEKSAQELLLDSTDRVLQSWPELREEEMPQLAAAAIMRYFFLINGRDPEKDFYTKIAKNRDAVIKLCNKIGMRNTGMRETKM